MQNRGLHPAGPDSIANPLYYLARAAHRIRADGLAKPCRAATSLCRVIDFVGGKIPSLRFCIVPRNPLGRVVWLIN